MNNWPIIVTKKKIAENTVANSLAAWLPFDQLSCKFENIGGATPAPKPPARTSLAVGLVIVSS